MPKISVIIPCYKVEKYLPACLDSLLAQTFSDFEAICVNDGSPDRCAEILAEYAQKDIRIKVINQQNQGVSVARNNALKSAQGEYTVFLDADDELSPYFFEKMNTVLDQNPTADIAWCDFTQGTERPNWINDTVQTQNVTQPFTHYFLRCKPRIEASVWGKMFRRKTLEGISFPENLSYGEDLVVLYQALYNSSTAVFVPISLYFYRHRPESAMRSAFSSKRIDIELTVTKTLEQIFHDKPMKTPARIAFDFFIARRFFNMVFKMPKKQDEQNYRFWRYQYIPVLKQLEKEHIFHPHRLTINKRILYWWYTRNL